MIQNDPVLDLTYAYSFQRQRYQSTWTHPMLCKESLNCVVVENGWLLPPWNNVQDLLWGTGGVADSKMRPVPESWMVTSSRAYMAGTYDIKKEYAKHLEGEYIYLGLIFNHWGHFLVDLVTRLYMVRSNPDAKFVFLSFWNSPVFKPINAISRFFELSGLKKENIIFINRPTSVEKLLIPEQSYVCGKYISSQYLEIFDTVTTNIEESISPPPPRKSCYRDCHGIRGGKKSMGANYGLSALSF